MSIALNKVTLINAHDLQKYEYINDKLYILGHLDLFIRRKGSIHVEDSHNNSFKYYKETKEGLVFNSGLKYRKSRVFIPEIRKDRKRTQRGEHFPLNFSAKFGTSIEYGLDLHLIFDVVTGALKLNDNNEMLYYHNRLPILSNIHQVQLICEDVFITKQFIIPHVKFINEIQRYSIWLWTGTGCVSYINYNKLYELIRNYYEK